MTFLRSPVFSCAACLLSADADCCPLLYARIALSLINRGEILVCSSTKKTSCNLVVVYSTAWVHVLHCS